MKDELIDAMNKKIEQNRRFITVSTFCLICTNFLLKLLLIPVKHFKLINYTDVNFIKKNFWNYS